MEKEDSLALRMAQMQLFKGLRNKQKSKERIITAVNDNKVA